MFKKAFWVPYEDSANYPTLAKTMEAISKYCEENGKSYTFINDDEVEINGKISNKEENSFVYAVPKDESEREDTITIQLSDNENGRSYEYTIPLIFANSIPQ